MRNKWTQIAAALLITATVGTFTFLGQTATVAYALEQTIEANHGLRTIHIRVESARDGFKEIWTEFGEDGKLLRLRMNAPKTEDGEKEVVWNEGRAEVWFKTKGHALILHDKETAEKISRELAAFDPKLILEKLHEAQANGKVVIETREPSEERDPITLVVSFNDSPDKQDIYQINPQTKLVEQFEKYGLVDDKRTLILRLEYREYNQEISPEMFVLDIPAGVTRIDWTTQEVGLSKGDLTDNQIAVKVAREFFEALIAKDYARAGVVYEGMPAEKIEKGLGKIEFLRIVSVGEPTPHPNARTRFLQVPCEVEIRTEGETSIEEFTPNIRAIQKQSDRWSIGGGI